MNATSRLGTLRNMLDMSMRQAALGAAIKQARKEKGLKQRQLAAQIPGRDGPVDTQTVSRWERGEHVPDLDTLELVAQALGKPLSYFVEDDATPTQPVVESLVQAAESLEKAAEALAAAGELQLQNARVFRDLLASAGGALPQPRKATRRAAS